MGAKLGPSLQEGYVKLVGARGHSRLKDKTLGGKEAKKKKHYKNTTTPSTPQIIQYIVYSQSKTKRI